jgi:hypothetical protein
MSATQPHHRRSGTIALGGRWGNGAGPRTSRSNLTDACSSAKISATWVDAGAGHSGSALEVWQGRPPRAGTARVVRPTARTSCGLDLGEPRLCIVLAGQRTAARCAWLSGFAFHGDTNRSQV